MKINCTIDKEYIKYVEELILLVTSRENLTFNENTQDINIHIEVSEPRVLCRLTFENSFIKPITYCETNDELKLMLKRCIFQVLSEFLQRLLSPWGILTGVRPTKVIQGFVDDGLKRNEIEREFEHNYLVSPEKIQIMYNIRDEQNKFLYKLKNCLHLYIGIPFCPSRCSYCSFTSYTTGKSKSLIAPYLKGLIEEIQYWGQYVKDRNIKLGSIYIGGGTPSSLNGAQIEELLFSVEKNFNIPNLLEYTFEGGRPDTLTKEKLEIVKKYGITRLSINPQTMNNKTLEKIGRTHTKEDFIKVYNEARELGFNWINTDLIIGLEDEGYEDFKNTLAQIVFLNPENITIHSLALKRAALQRGKSNLAFDEAKKIMDLIYQAMEQNGYNPYYLYRQKSMAGNQENVGFSKSGFASPYNIISIEESASVIALGCGAISKIVTKDEIIRYPNPKDPNQYLAKLTQKTQGDEGFKDFLKKLGEYLDTN